jgi:hypothetical protein
MLNNYLHESVPHGADFVLKMLYLNLKTITLIK